MRNSLQILFYTFLTFCFFACATKRGTKVYKILTTEQANKIHKYFTVKKPKEWSIYFDRSHGIILYSPLGTKRKKRYKTFELTDSLYKRTNAKEVYEYNSDNKIKKGVYWDCYVSVNYKNKDSIKVYNFNDLVDDYLKNKNQIHKNNFKYELLKQQHPKYGEIIFFKYGDSIQFNNITNIDAFILGKNRIYRFHFFTVNEYYKYYLNEAIEIINSIEIIE